MDYADAQDEAPPVDIDVALPVSEVADDLSPIDPLPGPPARPTAGPSTGDVAEDETPGDGEPDATEMGGSPELAPVAPLPMPPARPVASASQSGATAVLPQPLEDFLPAAVAEPIPDLQASETPQSQAPDAPEAVGSAEDAPDAVDDVIPPLPDPPRTAAQTAGDDADTPAVPQDHAEPEPERAPVEPAPVEPALEANDGVMAASSPPGTPQGAGGGPDINQTMDISAAALRAQLDATSAAEEAPQPPVVPADDGDGHLQETDGRPWVRLYPPGVPETYRYPLVPITRFLDDGAQDFPDSQAMVFLGTETTYRALSEQVDRLSAALRELGLAPGDRVAISLPWTPQLIIVLHAVWRAGLVAVLSDPTIGMDRLLDRIEATRPRAIVLLDSDYPGLATARGRLGSLQHVMTTGLLDPLPALRAKVQGVRMKLPTVTIPAEDGVLDLNTVMAASPPTGTQTDITPDDTPAVILFDGDDVVTLTHLNLVAAAFQARLWIPDVQAGREAVIIAGSPGDAFTLTAGVLQAMLSAATLVLAEPRNGATAKAIDDLRPSLLIGTDAGLTEVLAPASKRRDLSSVRIVLSSAPPGEPAMGAAMQSRTGARFRTAISSPTLGGMVAAQPVYGEARPEIQGLPITDTEMAVAEANEQGVGTLVARGPQVPVSTGTWVSTGYLGSVDDRGQVKVVGRVGSVVSHSHGTSDPSAMATVLRRMDGVLDAIVRSEFVDDGIVLVADVTVETDANSSAQLEAHLIRQLPNQSPPGQWNVTVVVQPKAPEPEQPAPAEEFEQPDQPEHPEENEQPEQFEGPVEPVIEAEPDQPGMATEQAAAAPGSTTADIPVEQLPDAPEGDQAT